MTMGQCKAEYLAPDPRDKKTYTFYCVHDDRHKGPHEDHWGRQFTDERPKASTFPSGGLPRD